MKTLNTKAKDNFGHEYKAFLKFTEYGLSLKFEGCPSGWNVDTIMLSDNSRLAIDFGQNWFVENLNEIRSEMSKVLKGK